MAQSGSSASNACCSCLYGCICCIYRWIRFACCLCGCCCTGFWVLLIWALVSISINLSDVDFDTLDDTCYHKLGLTPEATQNEIAKAFRKLALKYHPDKVLDEDKKKEYEKIFQEISKCYEILKDEDMRQKYDAAGYRETNSFGIPFDDDISFKDIFQFFYDNFDFDFDFDDENQQKQQQQQQQKYQRDTQKDRKKNKDKNKDKAKQKPKKKRGKRNKSLKDHTINLKLEDIVNDKQQTIKIGREQFILEIPGGIPNGYIIADELNGYNWKIKVSSKDKKTKWERYDDDSYDLYQSIKITRNDIKIGKKIEITMIDGTKETVNLKEIDHRKELKLEQYGLKKFQTKRKYKNKGNAYVRFDVYDDKDNKSEL